MTTSFELDPVALAQNILDTTTQRDGGGGGFGGGYGGGGGNDDDTGSTGSGGGTTSSGSTSPSSPSSSSSSAPPEPKDPYDAWYGNLPTIEKKRISGFDSIYMDLWGEPAPLAVLQEAVKLGLNTEEFRIAQMKNEAWWDTSFAADVAQTYDNTLMSLRIDPVYNRKKKKDGNGKGNGKPPKGGGHRRDHDMALRRRDTTENFEYPNAIPDRGVQ
jgi:hypothetical protein